MATDARATARRRAASSAMFTGFATTSLAPVSIGSAACDELWNDCSTSTGMPMGWWRSVSMKRSTSIVLWGRVMTTASQPLGRRLDEIVQFAVDGIARDANQVAV